MLRLICYVFVGVLAFCPPQMCFGAGDEAAKPEVAKGSETKSVSTYQASATNGTHIPQVEKG